jgi:predicted anti-sigma-YlaC factor YlaD
MRDWPAEELDCGTAVELVADHLEGATSLDEGRRLELHLLGCDGCRDYLVQVGTVLRVAGRPVVDAVPPRTMAGLLRALRDWRR